VARCRTTQGRTTRRHQRPFLRTFDWRTWVKATSLVAIQFEARGREDRRCWRVGRHLGRRWKCSTRSPEGAKVLRLTRGLPGEVLVDRRSESRWVASAKKAILASLPVDQKMAPTALGAAEFPPSQPPRLVTASSLRHQTICQWPTETAERTPPSLSSEKPLRKRANHQPAG
jgi:hypothetical protein